MGIKINEDTKKMADFLRSGNTMLNMACPVCNNPLFRKKSGETFCPICNRKVLIVKNEINQNSKTINKKTIDNKEQEEQNYNSDNVTLNLLKRVLFKKIEWITQQLKSDTQTQSIEIYTNILSNILNVLSKFPTFDP